jgi:transcriptional antiterminator Rof (Rho-off)
MMDNLYTNYKWVSLTATIKPELACEKHHSSRLLLRQGKVKTGKSKHLKFQVKQRAKELV